MAVSPERPSQHSLGSTFHFHFLPVENCLLRCECLKAVLTHLKTLAIHKLLPWLQVGLLEKNGPPFLITKAILKTIWVCFLGRQRCSSIPSTLLNGRLSWKISLIIPLTFSSDCSEPSRHQGSSGLGLSVLPGMLLADFSRQRFCTGMLRAGNSTVYRGCVFCSSPISLSFPVQNSHVNLFWYFGSLEERKGVAVLSCHCL